MENKTLHTPTHHTKPHHTPSNHTRTGSAQVGASRDFCTGSTTHRCNAMQAPSYQLPERTRMYENKAGGESPRIGSDISHKQQGNTNLCC